jgi:membrane protease YdiL (CAAX protease family)
MRIPWWSPALWVGLCLAWRKDAGIPALLGYHLLCALAILLARPAIRWGQWPRWGSRLVLPMVLLAPALFWLPKVPGFPMDHLRHLVARWPGGLLTHALYVLVVNVPLEEVFWRSYVEAGRPGWSPWRQGLAFSLHHLVGAALAMGWKTALPACVLTAAAGAFWTWTARRQGGLGLPVITHALADLGLMALAAAQLR